MKNGEFLELIPVGAPNDRKWLIYDFDTIRFHEHNRKAHIDSGDVMPTTHPYNQVGVLFNYSGLW